MPAIDRLVGSIASGVDPATEATLFIEWLADPPCTGNGSSQLCRVNSPDDPSWCCHACRAFLIRYGRDPERWA